MRAGISELTMSWLAELRRKKFMDPATAFLYLVPAGVIIVVFRMVPIASAFLVSFFDVRMGKLRGFIGLAHYAKLVQDATFWSSLGTTAYYASRSSRRCCSTRRSRPSGSIGPSTSCPS
jgi:ABC-type spermidine/putrescine transport system permease subunit I